MKKRKRIRKIEKRIAALETQATTPPSIIIRSTAVDAQGTWRDTTTSDYTAGGCDGWLDLDWAQQGYL